MLLFISHSEVVHLFSFPRSRLLYFSLFSLCFHHFCCCESGHGRWLQTFQLPPMEEGFTQRTRHQFIFAVDMAVRRGHQQIYIYNFVFQRFTSEWPWWRCERFSFFFCCFLIVRPRGSVSIVTSILGGGGFEMNWHVQASTLSWSKCRK